MVFWDYNFSANDTATADPVWCPLKGTVKISTNLKPLWTTKAYVFVDTFLFHSSPVCASHFSRAISTPESPQPHRVG